MQRSSRKSSPSWIAKRCSPAVSSFCKQLCRRSSFRPGVQLSKALNVNSAPLRELFQFPFSKCQWGERFDEFLKLNFSLSPAAQSFSFRLESSFPGLERSKIKLSEFVYKFLIYNTRWLIYCAMSRFSEPLTVPIKCHYSLIPIEKQWSDLWSSLM